MGHIARRSIEQMVLAMRHRGPDDSGVYEDDLIAMGMTRLAIIDTSKYEMILLKGDSKKCKNETLNITLKLLDDSFFQGAFDIITEFQKDKRIEFEFPQKRILTEVFPTFLFLRLTVLSGEINCTLSLCLAEVIIVELFPLMKLPVFPVPSNP